MDVDDMSLIVDLTPEETRRFEAAGIDLTSFLKGIAASLPPEPDSASQPSPLLLDPKSVAAIAYLQGKVNRAISDPEAIRRVDAELEGLQRRLNDNRIAAGETTIFPE